DAMPALIHEATGVDVSEFLDRHAYGKADVPLEELLEYRGITLTRATESTTPSLGVRLKPVAETVTIATAYEHGAAHRGGLSAGDQLVALEGLRITNATSLERL